MFFFISMLIFICQKKKKKNYQNALNFTTYYELYYCWLVICDSKVNSCMYVVSLDTGSNM